MKRSVEQLLALGLSSATLAVSGCDLNGENKQKSERDTPDITFAGHIINGLRAIYDEDKNTKFDTSGLVMERVPKEAGSTALRGALNQSVKSFSEDGRTSHYTDTRIRANVTCAATAINNPKFQVYYGGNQETKLATGLYHLQGGETLTLLAGKAEAAKDHKDAGELMDQADDAFKLAEKNCLDALEGSAGSIDIPIRAK